MARVPTCVRGRRRSGEWEGEVRSRLGGARTRHDSVLGELAVAFPSLSLVFLAKDGLFKRKERAKSELCSRKSESQKGAADVEMPASSAPGA